MKRSLSPTGKSTLFALAFFVVMTFVGLTAAHAQNDTLNPLLSTTGPNVLGSGRIQWSSSLDYYHLSQKYNQGQSVMASNSFEAVSLPERPAAENGFAGREAGADRLPGDGGAL